MSPLGFFGEQKQKKGPKKLPQKPKKVVVSIGRQVGGTSYPSDAKVTAREIIQDARDEAFRIKKAAEEEASKIRQESLELEKRLAQKEDLLDERSVQVEKQEKQLTILREALSTQEEELAKLRSELVNKLEKISSLTAEEAKKLILENLQSQLKNEIAKRIKEAKEETKPNAGLRPGEILANAMMAGAPDWVPEFPVP